MAEVKCGRCDRRYSGLRARCPYCGARRGKQGKHAKDYDNSKGRFVIGLILVLVLVVAVITVIATSMTEAQKDAAGEDQQQTDQGVNIGDSDGVTNIEGAGADADAETGDTDADTGTEGSDEPVGEDGGEGDGEGTVEGSGAGVGTAVNNLYIVSPWSDSPQTDFTAAVGDVIDFDYVSEPELEDAEVLWATSDDSVFVVLQTGEFTAIGAGTATLSLTVNDKTVELQVIVN